ncbi:T-cell-interacting, activating receptor on myeloid cells protein 1-like [Pelodiscus sinensis]|uniref:T-cell-interacting, activating receptor on myeloid cells protein 1-like n=1 Tax=Pelodiscus sinensis TaxID=13735 RepID=UPI003F6D14B4
MASALTVLFLGCWLAGQSGAQGREPHNKPSISASPRGVIPVGGHVTIRCWTEQLGVRFLLYKDRAENYLNYKDPAGSEAEFTIPSARLEDGGNYTCRYSCRTGAAAYSVSSDPVQIMVLDPSLPRPSVSLSPTGVTVPGADVTIRCQGPGGDVRFFLHQAGDLTRPRPMDPAGDGAEFHICPVGRQHGGSYSCSYRPRAEPFVSSAPSDPVELVVAEGTDPAGPQHPDPPTTAPQGADAGSTSADGTAPTLLETLSTPSPSATDAGSTPARGTHPTLLGTTATETQPGESESESNGAIVAGVIVGAAGLLLLLLLLGFHHRRRTRAREGTASRQSRESEAATIVYALVGHRKQQDVPPQEPDTGAEGLTYAELDRQVLQAKQEAPAPALEPVLYATVSRSQGTTLLPP